MSELFGRYELRGLLGRGGMGEVFRAYDTVRGREVALKLLPGHLAGDASFQERFRRESRTAAMLSAPHVIPIHDFGEIDGRLFLDMRLVQGQDLAAMLRSAGRLDPAVAVEVIGQVASALDAAHAAGLVHRDVKPSNVLVTDLGGGRPFAYLVDFGLARPVAQDSEQLTSTGAVGTLPYLPPERIVGEPGDHRGDVYALACMLFELLTGRKPWDGDMYTVLSGHLKGALPRVTADVPGLPAALDRVVAIGMAKRPDDRYSRAGDLAREAREALLPPSATIARPPAGVPPVPPTAAATDPRTLVPGGGYPSTGPSFAPLVTPARAAPSRQGRVLAVLAAVVVAVLAAVVAVVASRDDGGTPVADPTTSGPSTTAPTGLRSGTGPNARWSDFASFSQLVGTKDKDTAHAFQGAKCELSGPQDGDPRGVVSRVVCGGAVDPTTIFLARFQSADLAREYLDGVLQDDGVSVSAWGTNGLARGLAYGTQGATPDDANAIDTTVCGLPTYVIRFVAQDPSISLSGLREQVWGAATFPDVVPPACAADLSGPTGAAGAAMSAAKPTVPFTPTQVSALLERGGEDTDAYSLGSPSGIESLVFDQIGNLTFWSSSAAGLSRTGTGRYPMTSRTAYYNVAFATVFDDMKHVSFIFRGPFTRAGRDEDVVLTYGPKGWGPLVRQGTSRLVTSTFPITAAARFTKISTPGLTVLRTMGTSTQTWRWDGTGFVPR